MPRQKPRQPIRRCLNCNHKIHRRFWKNDVCPICGEPIGFSLSSHGGLKERDLLAIRGEWRRKKIGNTR